MDSQIYEKIIDKFGNRLKKLEKQQEKFQKVNKNSIPIKNSSDILNILWENKDTNGITQILARILYKKSNIILDSKSEKPFPLKRSTELLGLMEFSRIMGLLL